MSIVYITCKNKKEAEKVSLYLLKKRHIACANIIPIKSMYWWENKIVRDNECLIIGKTNKKNFKDILREVKKLHSYKIPCILRVDAVADKDYQTWVDKELVK